MFTRVELTDWNTPRLFLMFYIHLHLLSISFWKLWFNLTMESFKSSCIWKHPLFCWWFSSKTEVKNNYYVQIFLFYLLIFIRPFEKRDVLCRGNVRPSVRLSVCPSVRPSVRPRFPDFSSTCFEVSIWNLVYTFSRWHDMSSLSCITIGSFWPSLQPKVGQTHFLQSWPHKLR